MGRPRTHDLATGETLLDAAEALLREGGPDALSVRAVADEAGTTTRAVYSVFGSKERMLQHLAKRGYLLLAGFVDAVEPTDDPREDLVRAGLEGFRRFAIERPHLFRLTFERVTSEVRDDVEVQRASGASYQALAAHLERARAAGVLGGRSIPEAAFQFHAACQGLATNELLHEPPPIGSRLWAGRFEFDGPALWRGALRALVTGMAGTTGALPAAVRTPDRRRG